MRESSSTTFLLSTALRMSPGEELAAEMATSSVARFSLYRDASKRSLLLSFSCRVEGRLSVAFDLHRQNNYFKSMC